MVRAVVAGIACCLALLIFFASAHAQTAYPPGTPLNVLKPNVNMRAGAGTNTAVRGRLQLGETVFAVRTVGAWIEVALPGERGGFVFHDLVSDLRLVILKREGAMVLMRGGEEHGVFSATMGDPGPAQGRYVLALPPRQGDAELRLVRLDRQPLRQALVEERLTMERYRVFVRESRTSPAGVRPVLVRVGAAPAEGVGVLAETMAQLAPLLVEGTRVEVYDSGEQERTMNAPDALSYALYQGARRQLDDPASFVSAQDSAVFELDYPGGDIQPGQACSADVLVRAARAAGLDLQVQVHEDVLQHPREYAQAMERVDASLNHRQAEVLALWLSRNARALDPDVADDPLGFEAGDILVFERGENHEVFLGIVSETIGPSSLPLVITVRGPGHHVAEEDLLGQGRGITVTARYRLAHRFDYW